MYTRTCTRLTRIILYTLCSVTERYDACKYSLEVDLDTFNLIYEVEQQILEHGTRFGSLLASIEETSKGRPRRRWDDKDSEHRVANAVFMGVYPERTPIVATHAGEVALLRAQAYFKTIKTIIDADEGGHFNLSVALEKDRVRVHQTKRLKTDPLSPPLLFGGKRNR